MAGKLKTLCQPGPDFIVHQPVVPVQDAEFCRFHLLAKLPGLPQRNDRDRCSGKNINRNIMALQRFPQSLLIRDQHLQAQPDIHYAVAGFLSNEIWSYPAKQVCTRKPGPAQPTKQRCRKIAAEKSSEQDTSGPGRSQQAIKCGGT